MALLLYKNCLLQCLLLCGVFIEKYVCTKFHNWLLCQWVTWPYVPIVMYGLRLFIVVLQELHCLPNCLHACMIRVRRFCYSIPSGFTKCIAWGCLLLFNKNYIVYYNVYCMWCVHWKVCVYQVSYWLLCEYMPIYVSIVMYGLRLSIVVLQELHCLSNCLHVFMIRVRGCYHVTKFRYSTPSGVWDS